MIGEDWQKPYVQCVLDYHNKKHSTNFAVAGRCEKIYPELKGRLSWDWCASDKSSGGAAAIEVKRLTNPQLQEKYSALHQICYELSGELSGKLKGTFLLTMGIGEEQRFDLQGDKKQRLKDTLNKLILKEAPSLRARKEQDIGQALRKRLPDIVPEHSYCALYKFDDEGSYLSPNVVAGWLGPHGELQGEDLIQFQQLVQSANQQLAEAKKKGIAETFLIIVEIGFSGADADVIQSTLQKFTRSNYQHIEFWYLVYPVSPPKGPYIHDLSLG